MTSFKEAEEELWKCFECANLISKCCIDFNMADDREVVDMYQGIIMNAFIATPINYEIFKNLWENLADPARTQSPTVTRKCLNRYHKWLAHKLFINDTRFEPWPPVATTAPPPILAPALRQKLGPQAVRQGLKNAPARTQSDPWPPPATTRVGP